MVRLRGLAFYFDMGIDSVVIEILQLGHEFKNMFDAFVKFIINTANSFFDESNLSEEDMERMFVNITNKMKGGKEETPTIDEILDKISNKGIESLSLSERKILDEYSNN